MHEHGLDGFLGCLLGVEACRPLDADMEFKTSFAMARSSSAFSIQLRAVDADVPGQSATLIQASSVENGGPFDRARGRGFEPGSGQGR